MERIKPVTNEIYHIYNRGVEKRNVFLDNADYLRFIHDLFEFNDVNPTHKFYIPVQFSEVRLPKIAIAEKREREPRKLLVELMIFCLIPNHFHLMVRQKVKNGITEFMRKIGTGYTNYFNQKYKRVGPLFQGKYKAVPIKNESHFIHLPYYIHSNPLDLYMPKWRKGEITNYKKAVGFLENYRWSSFPDYINLKNFPSTTQREFILGFYEGFQNYKTEFTDWLRTMELETIQDIALE